MSDMSQARRDLATLLAGIQVSIPGHGLSAIPTVSSVAEDATPPLIQVGPADPYITFEDVSFGEKRLNLVAIPVAEGSNEYAADQIDDIVSACLVRLLAGESPFEVDVVDRPGKITLNGQPRLAVVIRVSTVVPLGL
jgi:hypothetical protein